MQVTKPPPGRKKSRVAWERGYRPKTNQLNQQAGFNGNSIAIPNQANASELRETRRLRDQFLRELERALAPEVVS